MRVSLIARSMKRKRPINIEKILQVAAMVHHHIQPKTSSKRKQSVRHRTILWFSKHASELSHREFRRLYRLGKETFSKVVDLVNPLCQRKQLRLNSKIASVKVEVMLAVALRILAGASYLDVSWPYGIATSTVYDIFHEMLEAMDNVLPKIQFPKSEQEYLEAAETYVRLSKVPIKSVVSSLDGIAIEIKQPSCRDTSDPKKYYNRKKFFAICVQAAVTANYKFVFLSASFAGSTHDSTAFQSSKLYSDVINGTLPQWAIIIGDEAYCNERNIVTPYGGRQISADESNFNHYISRCRVKIEQAFGLWVNRFGLFWSPIRFRLKVATKIIGVTAKLHNFIIDNEEGNVQDLDVHEENNVIGSPVLNWQNNLHMEGDVTRSRSGNESNLRTYLKDELKKIGYTRPRRVA